MKEGSGRSGLAAAGEPGDTVADIASVVSRVTRASSNLPASLLIRHSIREPIVDPRKTFGAMLTAEGRAAARRLGEALPHDVDIILYHSPVPRCRDTALLVAKGAGGRAEVAGGREYLACSYLYDEEAVFAKFDEGGPGRFVSDWFSGRYPPAWIDAPSVAAPKLLRAILKEEKKRKAIHMHVSHDWNVLLLRGLADALAVRDAPWPGFLSGVLVERRNGVPHLDWGEGPRRAEGDWR